MQTPTKGKIMVIKRLGALSMAKLMGLLYAGIGLLFGGIFALFSLLGGGAMMASGSEGSGMGMGLMAGMGLAAVLVLPILYGCLGFIAGLISAFLFNLAAKFTGGLEIDIQ